MDLEEERQTSELENLPGARWIDLSRRLSMRFRMSSRLREAALNIMARREPAARFGGLRTRVQSTRARALRPVPVGVPAPPVPADASESPEQNETASEARGLDPILRSRIEALLRRPIPDMRLHTGNLADRQARRHQADAVTLGRDVYFRTGAFDPGTTQGMALLAHEATHVAWKAGARLADEASPASQSVVEERAALNVERSALGVNTRPTSTPQRVTPQAAPLASTTSPATVKAAAASRDLDTDPMPRAAEIPDSQIRSLKEDLYRTLLDKMRSDFERGA